MVGEKEEKKRTPKKEQIGYAVSDQFKSISINGFGIGKRKGLLSLILLTQKPFPTNERKNLGSIMSAETELILSNEVARDLAQALIESLETDDEDDDDNGD